LRWEDADPGLPRIDSEVVNRLVLDTAISFERGRGDGAARPGPAIGQTLQRYAEKNATRLGLDRKGEIEVEGFNASFRTGAGGQLMVDLVVRYVQTAPKELQDRFGPALGGIPLRGGATVVADATGRVRHVISKPVPSTGGAGADRLDQIADFVAHLDGYGLLGPLSDEDHRVVSSLTFAKVDGAYA